MSFLEAIFVSLSAVIVVMWVMKLRCREVREFVQHHIASRAKLAIYYSKYSLN